MYIGPFAIDVLMRCNVFSVYMPTGLAVDRRSYQYYSQMQMYLFYTLCNPECLLSRSHVASVNIQCKFCSSG